MHILLGSAVMSGWLPVYDTMHGIRGEVNILVKVDLFSDFNRFRQSSCGVQFFFSKSNIKIMINFYPISVPQLQKYLMVSSVTILLVLLKNLWLMMIQNING